MFPGGSLGVAEDAGGSPNEEYEEKLEVREFVEGGDVDLYDVVES